MSEDKTTIVWVEGTSSKVLDGSKVAERYPEHALPRMLEDGWSIEREMSAAAGAYFILSPPPKPVEPLSPEQRRQQDAEAAQLQRDIEASYRT